jgi:hypothetical protein
LVRGPVERPESLVIPDKIRPKVKRLTLVWSRSWLARPVGGEHICLVVNDESPSAQLATVRDRRFIANPRTVDLIAGRGARLADTVPPDGVFGSEAAARPSTVGRCPDRSIEEDFDEFDGEGVAWASGPSGVFYVVGSHSCGGSTTPVAAPPICSPGFEWTELAG